LIVSGQVTVNGVVVTELGAKADPEKDRVEAAGRTAEQPGAAGYYILHKPPHVVSTMSDPEGRATLRHVLRGLAGGVFPVGRLDYSASGLILLTSDGQLADRLFKVSSSLVQVNWVKLKGRPSADTLSKVTHQARARIRLLPAPDAAGGHADNPWYEAELRGARRDLLRESFFAAGHPVEKMKRVRLGPLDLGALGEGQYRKLEPNEVESLRRAVEQAVKQGGEQAAGQAPSRPAVRAFERKKWGAKRDAARAIHETQGGAPRGKEGRREGRPGDEFGAGPRGEHGAGQWPRRDKFAAAAPRSGAPGKRPWGAGRPAQGGKRHGPGRPFSPGGGAWRGDRPSGPPRSDSPGRPPDGGRPFPPSGGRGGERGGGAWRGSRPSGPPRGDRPSVPPRGPRPSGPPRGGRPFPSSGGRGGESGAGRPFGRDKFPPGRQGGPSGGGGRRPGQPLHRGPRGKSRDDNRGAGQGAWRGDRPSGPPTGGRPSGPPRGNRPGGPPRSDRKFGSGKFVPRGPRAGGSGPGKSRGKRPPGRPPGREDVPPEKSE
jgi:23S rRNA pseudouridine2605 synthase